MAKTLYKIREIFLYFFFIFTSLLLILIQIKKIWTL